MANQKSPDKATSDVPTFNQARNHLINQIKQEERRIEESKKRKAEYEAELAKLPSTNG